MVSNLIRNLAPSKTLALTDKIAQLKKEGIDVLAFNLGEPDFNTPETIIEAAKKAMDAGYTKYTPVAGILPLREEICRKLKTDNRLDYTPAQICVSTGAKQALVNAATVICNPGDEVLLFTPCWVSYVEIVKIAGGTPVMVPAMESNDFQPTEEDVRKAITPATKAMMLNSPNNPTGAIYSEETMRMLVSIAEEFDLVIISDEIYEKLVYTDEKPVSPAALSVYAMENTITINGFSKSYAMTGWRIGYTAAPAPLAKGISSLQSHTTSNANTIAQYAAIAALRECSDTIVKMKEEFNRRRNYLYDRLTAMNGISCVNGKGAFYLMPNVKEYFGKTAPDGTVISDSVDFCEYMLSDAKIAIVPGDAFFSPENVRISYSTSLENIVKGADAFEKALARLS